MIKAIIASAALLFCLTGATLAAEKPCSTFDMVAAQDLELLHGAPDFATYDQVLLVDLTGLPAQNAVAILVKQFGAPQSALAGARVAIFTGQPPKGSDGTAVDAHLYVFGIDGCMMGGTALPMSIAASFIGLGA